MHSAHSMFLKAHFFSQPNYVKICIFWDNYQVGPEKEQSVINGYLEVQDT